MTFRNGSHDEEPADPRARFWRPAAAQTPSPAWHLEVVTITDPVDYLQQFHVEIAHFQGKWFVYGVGRPGRVAHSSGLNEVVARIAQRWALSDDEVALLLGIESAEVAADIMRGYAPLRGRDVEDRVANLFRIFEAAFGLFDGPDAEREWIRHPADSFGGKSCLEAMLQGGIEDLVDVRRVIEHIAGR